MIEGDWQIEAMDVLDWAAEYDGPKFHALLCDPPYELGFMGKDWDRSGIAFKPDTWAALAEHLHPGAFGMAFASARGWHRLAVAIEDAGLRIHPSIFGWAYGSGFPKASRLDSQIDKAAGAEREIVGLNPNARPNSGRTGGIMGEAKGRVFNTELTQPFTPLARAWQGHRYGLQALKPALEPIIVFQKPYQGKPVNCITETGAGALWIDGGRINSAVLDSERRTSVPSPGIWGHGKEHPQKEGEQRHNPQGRWPANFCLVHHPECQRVGTRRAGSGERKTSGKRAMRDNPVYGVPNTTRHAPDNYGEETITAWDCVPECPVRKLGEQSGERPMTGRPSQNPSSNPGMFQHGGQRESNRHYDTGTAARFFFQADWNLESAEPVLYCAKASRRERDAGLEEMPLQKCQHHIGQLASQDGRPPLIQRNPHPTVKPIALARWLATLLLPPPEYAPRRILIPFSGSGSEGIGAGLAGWDDITMIDNEAEYCQIAEARMAHWLNQPQQLTL